MSTETLLSKIDAYCEAAGISPSTLGVRAVGNSRLYDRLRSRLDRDADMAARIEAYMAANPPAKAGSQSVQGDAA